MEENTVIALRQPGAIADPLTEALRNGARAWLRPDGLGARATMR
jgi:hypothetical protein